MNIINMKKAVESLKGLTLLSAFDTIFKTKEQKQCLTFGDRESPSMSRLMEKVYSPMIKNLTMFDNPISMVPVEKFKSRLKINSNVLDPLDELKSIGCNFVLAGGKLRDFVSSRDISSSFNDYDLWFLDEKSWDLANEYFDTTFRLHCRRKKTIKSHVVEYTVEEDGYTWNIQLVRGKYGSVEDLISDFDFSCCSIAYDGENIFYAKYALRDIVDKRIRFQNYRPNKNVFVRVEKYLKKGYFIRHGDYAIASIALLSNVENHPDNQVLFTNRENAMFVHDNGDYYPVGAAEIERWQLKDERIGNYGMLRVDGTNIEATINLDDFDLGVPLAPANIVENITLERPRVEGTLDLEFDNI